MVGRTKSFARTNDDENQIATTTATTTTTAAVQQQRNMTTPWERITDDTYKSWLSARQVIASEYNGASLVDRSALRGQFEQQQQQQPPQQQQLLPEETVAALISMAEEHMKKEGTIVISDATKAKKSKLLDFLHLPEAGAIWPKRPSTLGVFPEFKWLASNEDSAENRDAYMTHLQAHVGLPEDYSMADVYPYRDLLNSEIIGNESGSQRLRGTTDVVITESINIINETFRNQIQALMELKKPENMIQKDHTPQAVCEHLSASALNPKCGVVSVLTDLKDYWTVYWFGKTKSGVALYKLDLKNEKCAAGLAKYILENLKVESQTETLPTTFVDRLSFEAIMDVIINDERRKRARRDGSGGGGNSSHVQDGMPPHEGGGRPQPPPSGPDNNLSTGTTVLPSRNDNASGDGNQTMDVARALRLLAPHSNSDVANELDLLDMVDEAEQYEIVRSFVAKHIVPHMTGKTV